jgi:hypothetical protein
MNISQGEGGGNGVSTDVVKEWLLSLGRLLSRTGSELWLAIGSLSS